jgi:hypothetical protein
MLGVGGETVEDDVVLTTILQGFELLIQPKSLQAIVQDSWSARCFGCRTPY